MRDVVVWAIIALCCLLSIPTVEAQISVRHNALMLPVTAYSNVSTKKLGPLREAVEDAYVVSDVPCAGAPGHPHQNGGGFVANTALVDGQVYVGPNAQVCDCAHVWGDVTLEGYAAVGGTAYVEGAWEYAFETGRVHISSDASVSGAEPEPGGPSCTPWGARGVVVSARYGVIVIADRARILGSSAAIIANPSDVVEPDVVIGGDTLIGGSARVWGGGLRATLSEGKVVITGDAEIGNSHFIGGTGISPGIAIEDATVLDSEVRDSVRILGYTMFDQSVAVSHAEIAPYGTPGSNIVNAIRRSNIGGSARIHGRVSIKDSDIAYNRDTSTTMFTAPEIAGPQGYGLGQVEILTSSVERGLVSDRARLDAAIVEGGTVEDDAVVIDSTIADDAVVSGTSVVEGFQCPHEYRRSLVGGCAVVQDALVRGSTLTGRRFYWNTWECLDNTIPRCF